MRHHAMGTFSALLSLYDGNPPLMWRHWNDGLWPLFLSPSQPTYPPSQMVTPIWSFSVTMSLLLRYVFVDMASTGRTIVATDTLGATIWTNIGLFPVGPLRTKFKEISCKIETSSSKKMHVVCKMTKYLPFYPGLFASWGAAREMDFKNISRSCLTSMIQRWRKHLSND